MEIEYGNEAIPENSNVGALALDYQCTSRDRWRLNIVVHNFALQGSGLATKTRGTSAVKRPCARGPGGLLSVEKQRT